MKELFSYNTLQAESVSLLGVSVIITNGIYYYRKKVPILLKYINSNSATISSIYEFLL